MPDMQVGIAEAARITGLHQNTIRAALQRGSIKGTRELKLGPWQVAVSDLLAYSPKIGRPPKFGRPTHTNQQEPTPEAA